MVTHDDSRVTEALRRSWPASPWPAFILGFAGFAAIALILTGLKDRPPIRFDSHFGLPMMPNAPYETSHHVWATVIMTCFGLIGLGAGLRAYSKTRSLLPVTIALSTALLAIPEVFFDIMGGVYFPW